MIPATEPLFEITPVAVDPVAARIKEIVPQATAAQVDKLCDFVAEQIDLWAYAPASERQQRERWPRS